MASGCVARTNNKKVVLVSKEACATEGPNLGLPPVGAETNLYTIGSNGSLGGPVGNDEICRVKGSHSFECKNTKVSEVDGTGTIQFHQTEFDGVNVVEAEDASGQKWTMNVGEIGEIRVKSSLINPAELLLVGGAAAAMGISWLVSKVKERKTAVIREEWRERQRNEFLEQRQKEMAYTNALENIDNYEKTPVDLDLYGDVPVARTGDGSSIKLGSGYITRGRGVLHGVNNPGHNPTAAVKMVEEIERNRKTAAARKRLEMEEEIVNDESVSPEFRSQFIKAEEYFD